MRRIVSLGALLINLLCSREAPLYLLISPDTADIDVVDWHQYISTNVSLHLTPSDLSMQKT